MNNSAVEKLGNPRAIFLTIVGLTSHEDKWPRMNSCWTDFWWQVAENGYKVVKISEWVIRIRMYRTYVYNFKFYILLILVQKVVTTQNEQLVSRTFHLLHKNLCNHLLKKKGVPQSEFPQHLRLLISGESKFGMNKTPMCVIWDIYFFKKNIG